MPKNALALPDSLVQMLSAADRAKGFPLGTMASVMMQEVGGQESRFLKDPTTYHYEVDANGRRGPKGSDVVSTAFGPFGILDSTARDPGFGVAPLKNKADLAEQVRFYADYLDARSKSLGSLDAGLARVGEGEKYSREVARRRDGGATGVAAPVQVQAAPAQPEAAPVVLASAGPVVPYTGPMNPAPADPSKDAWTQAQLTTFAPQEPVTPESLQYGRQAQAAPVPARPGGAMSQEEVAALYDIPVGNRPSVGMFHGLSRLGRRQA